MTARPTLLFVHGWAFDASFWAPLRAALDDWPQAVFDAGYFGPEIATRAAARQAPPRATPDAAPPAAPAIDGPLIDGPLIDDPRIDGPLIDGTLIDGTRIDGPLVAIGHSMGVLRLLRGLPPGCIGLVSINGFPRFGAAPDFAEGVPLRMLDRMIKRLSADPAAVLQDFRQRCGEASAFGELQFDPLARDLNALRDEDQRPALAALSVPLLVLAGQDDPIVPPAMTRAAFDGRADAERHERAGGGHLLPVSDTAWCAHHISTFIDTVSARPAQDA